MPLRQLTRHRSVCLANGPKSTVTGHRNNFHLIPSRHQSTVTSNSASTGDVKKFPSTDRHERAWAREVIVARNSSETTPEDIISKISPLGFLSGNEREFSAVFLLTKAFAHWATQDDQFVTRAIERMVDTANAGNTEGVSSPAIKCKVLLGVIDRLPGPHLALGAKSETSEIQSNHARALRMQACPLQDHGYEGFAYCASSVHSLIPEDLNEKDETSIGASRSRRTEQSTIPSAQNQNTIAFHIRQSGGATTDAHASTTIIKMPLANTLFSNGHVSTMFVSQWHRGNSKLRLEKVSQSKVQHQTVTLPTSGISDRNHARPTHHDWSFGVADDKLLLAMPLIPLTAPREITASMGNIIRSLGNAPASQELEGAVSTYFRQNGIEPQAAAVWALVIPKEVAQKHSAFDTLALAAIDKEHSRVIKMLDGSPYELFSIIPFTLLLQGAHLRRVTSGGGGWGKHAGLLSLDPETDYGTNQSSEGETSTTLLDLDGFLDESHLVRSVASPSDYVRFYISPSPDTTTTSSAARLYSVNHEFRLDSIDFGVSPSTLDDMHSDIVLDQSNKDLAGVQVFKNHFGAMSEVGFSFGQVKQGAQVQTKVDIPFARLSYQIVGQIPHAPTLAQNDISNRGNNVAEGGWHEGSSSISSKMLNLASTSDPGKTEPSSREPRSVDDQNSRFSAGKVTSNIIPNTPQSKFIGPDQSGIAEESKRIRYIKLSSRVRFTSTVDADFRLPVNAGQIRPVRAQRQMTGNLRKWQRDANLQVLDAPEESKVFRRTDTSTMHSRGRQLLQSTVRHPSYIVHDLFAIGQRHFSTDHESSTDQSQTVARHLDSSLLRTAELRLVCSHVAVTKLKEQYQPIYTSLSQLIAKEKAFESCLQKLVGKRDTSERVCQSIEGEPPPIQTYKVGSRPLVRIYQARADKSLNQSHDTSRRTRVLDKRLSTRSKPTMSSRNLVQPPNLLRRQENARQDIEIAPQPEDEIHEPVFESIIEHLDMPSRGRRLRIKTFETEYHPAAKKILFRSLYSTFERYADVDETLEAEKFKEEAREHARRKQPRFLFLENPDPVVIESVPITEAIAKPSLMLEIPDIRGTRSKTKVRQRDAKLERIMNSNPEFQTRLGATSHRLISRTYAFGHTQSLRERRKITNRQALVRTHFVAGKPRLRLQKTRRTLNLRQVLHRTHLGNEGRPRVRQIVTRIPALGHRLLFRSYPLSGKQLPRLRKIVMRTVMMRRVMTSDRLVSRGYPLDTSQRSQLRSVKTENLVRWRDVRRKQGVALKLRRVWSTPPTTEYRFSSMTRRERASRMIKLSLAVESRSRRSEIKERNTHLDSMTGVTERPGKYTVVNPWERDISQDRVKKVESIFEEVINFDPSKWDPASRTKAR